MAIVSTSVKDENGHAVVTLTDHTGQRFTQTMWTIGLSQAEVGARVAAMAAGIELALAEGEFEQAIQS